MARKMRAVRLQRSYDHQAATLMQKSISLRIDPAPLDNRKLSAVWVVSLEVASAEMAPPVVEYQLPNQLSLRESRAGSRFACRRGRGQGPELAGKDRTLLHRRSGSGEAGAHRCDAPDWSCHDSFGYRGPPRRKLGGLPTFTAGSEFRLLFQTLQRSLTLSRGRGRRLHGGRGRGRFLEVL